MSYQMCLLKAANGIAEYLVTSFRLQDDEDNILRLDLMMVLYRSKKL